MTWIYNLHSLYHTIPTFPIYIPSFPSLLWIWVSYTNTIYFPIKSSNSTRLLLVYPTRHCGRCVFSTHPFPPTPNSLLRFIRPTREGGREGAMDGGFWWKLQHCHRLPVLCAARALSHLLLCYHKNSLPASSCQCEWASEASVSHTRSSLSERSYL